MAKKRSTQNFLDLSDAERAEAVKDFDWPLAPRRAKPLSRKQKLLWDKARKSKPDVSIHVTEGQMDFVIHLDPDLMKQARSYAARHKTSLPKMIDRGLRGLLAFGT